MTTKPLAARELRLAGLICGGQRKTQGLEFNPRSNALNACRLVMAGPLHLAIF